jgi:hypothetical protein
MTYPFWPEWVIPAAIGVWVAWVVLAVKGPEWIKRWRKIQTEPPPASYAAKNALPFIWRRVRWPLGCLAMSLIGWAGFAGFMLLPPMWGVAICVAVLIVLSADSWYPWLRGRR